MSHQPTPPNWIPEFQVYVFLSDWYEDISVYLAAGRDGDDAERRLREALGDRVPADLRRGADEPVRLVNGHYKAY